jgi:hypothetical protein
VFGETAWIVVDCPAPVIAGPVRGTRTAGSRVLECRQTASVNVAPMIAAAVTRVPRMRVAFTGHVDGYWRRYQRPTHRPNASLEKIAVAACQTS